MEDELTELSEINSKTDNLAITEEENADEAITNIFLKNERDKHIRKKN